MYTVLIIEDNKPTADRIAKTVPWAQLRCFLQGVYYDGSSGLSAIEKYHPDLIIMDIQLPGINGLEIIEKCITILPNVCVIFISAYDRFQYVYRALKLHAYDYLLKPFSQEELLQVIQNAVQQLNHDFDQSNLELLGINREILTPLLWQIIRYLNDNVGKSVKMEQLSEEFHISSSHLGRLILNQTGLHFHELQTRIRINRAKQLLRDGNSRVEEVANLVGYKNYTTFYKVFKAETGISPREFKNGNEEKEQQL